MELVILIVASLVHFIASQATTSQYNSSFCFTSNSAGGIITFIADQSSNCVYWECISVEHITTLEQKACDPGTAVSNFYSLGAHHPCTEEYGSYMVTYDCTRQSVSPVIQPPCYQEYVDSGTCRNGGIVTVQSDVCACDCTGTGYTDWDCSVAGEAAIPDLCITDWCLGNPCKNAAECISQCLDYVCVCAHPSTTGRNCEQYECTDSSECLHGGTCYRRAEAERAACFCPRGLEGDRCEREVHERYKCTDDSECLNGGTCSRPAGAVGTVCECPQGFYGDRCELIVHVDGGGSTASATTTTSTPAAATTNITTAIDATATSCPPEELNSQTVIQIDAEIYQIECNPGYLTPDKSYVQTVNCTDNNWESTILPCIDGLLTNGSNTTSRVQLTAAIVGGCMATTVVIATVVIVLCLIKRNKRRKESITTGENIAPMSGIRVRDFSEEIGSIHEDDNDYYCTIAADSIADVFVTDDYNNPTRMDSMTSGYQIARRDSVAHTYGTAVTESQTISNLENSDTAPAISDPMKTEAVPLQSSARETDLGSHGNEIEAVYLNDKKTVEHLPATPSRDSLPYNYVDTSRPIALNLQLPDHPTDIYLGEEEDLTGYEGPTCREEPEGYIVCI